jgi:hypothetical protein
MARTGRSVPAMIEEQLAAVEAALRRRDLAPSLRAFVHGILDGLRQLGGERLDILDGVPDWFLAGHRKEPTGRPPGRPKGAKDSYKRAPYRKNKDRNLPAAA